MTDTATYNGRATTIAEIASPYVFFALAAVGLVVGYKWLPAWFMVAQLLHIWSQQGGIRWFNSHGVAEYTDEKYASIIGWAVFPLIVVRLALSINWLESFSVLGNQGWASGFDPQQATYTGVVLGAALAVALSGVMRVKGLPWLVSAATFALILILAIGASGWIWEANALVAAPLILVGFLGSRIPLRINLMAAKRAALLEAGDEEESTASA